MQTDLRKFARKILPPTWGRRLQFLNGWPPIGWVRLGDLKRLKPIGPAFGYERGGQRIGRYYIENFLARQVVDIQGVVLEIGDSTYTRRFGGERIVRSEVLHAVAGNPQATMVGDLATGVGIPVETFDCLILTQVFPFIYDLPSAVINCRRSLKLGGVLLATFCGISQVSRYDMERWGDYWRFTDASAQRLFGDVFGEENVEVTTYGNVLVACAFLHGLAVSELKREELDYHDPDYQVIISVRAVNRGMT